MNPEVKDKWVAALRSGDYAQGRFELKSGGRHCCLGVLCEIAAKEIGFGIYENRAEIDRDENLGSTVAIWAGLEPGYGAFVRIGAVRDILSEHNDNGRTFAQIADAIEGQL